MTAKSHDPRTTELLAAAVASHDGERITLDELMAPLQRRAFGFLLLLIAVPNFIPVPLGIGGITGTLAGLLGLQMLIGLEQPWLPRWLEKLCKPRLERLTTHPLTIASGLMMMFLGVLLMLPIPFTNYLFGVMLLAFAFALIERDGGLLLVVWAATIASVGLSAGVARSLWAMMRDLL